MADTHYRDEDDAENINNSDSDFGDLQHSDISKKDLLLIVQIMDNSEGYNAYTRRKGKQNCSLFTKIMQQRFDTQVNMKRKQGVLRTDSDLLDTYIHGDRRVFK